MEAERKTFMATVLGNSLQKSKKQQTPSVAIRVRTEYDVEEPETPVRMNLIGNLWLTYKCMKQTVKTLQEAFSWKGHNITDFNEPILVGKKCQIVCEEEEYQGEMRWAIVFINRPGGLRKMEGPELTKLIADVQPMVDEMVGEKMDIPRDEGEPPPVEESGEEISSSAGKPPPEDFDDLPF